MALLILCDKWYYGTFWCDTKLRGIYDEAARRRIPVKLFTDETSFEEAAAKLGADSSVILLFDGIGYYKRILPMLSRLQIHPIFSLTEQGFRLPAGCSQVAGDVDSATGRMVEYLHSHGKRRIAMVGVIPGSAASLNKEEMLRRNVAKEDLRVFQVQDPKNNLEPCFTDFYAEREHFDAVMCINDHQAICLIEFLKARGAYDPGQFIISHGDTIMARLYDRGITTISTSFYNCGKTTVETHVNRLKYGWSATRTLIPCAITFRGTTDPLSPSWVAGDSTAKPSLGVFTGRLAKLERMLTQCDLVDLKLLYGLLVGYSYDKMGEACFFSGDAAKYRVRKMRLVLGTADRESMAALIGTYVTPENLLRTIEDLGGKGGKVFLQ